MSDQLTELPDGYERKELYARTKMRPKFAAKYPERFPHFDKEKAGPVNTSDFWIWPANNGTEILEAIDDSRLHQTAGWIHRNILEEDVPSWMSDVPELHYPFFILDEREADVAGIFVTDPLMKRCRHMMSKNYSLSEGGFNPYPKLGQLRSMLGPLSEL